MPALNMLVQWQDGTTEYNIYKTSKAMSFTVQRRKLTTIKQQINFIYNKCYGDVAKGKGAEVETMVDVIV